MNTCARCNKKLGFYDSRYNASISYKNASQAGLFSEFRDKRICISCQHGLLESKGIKYKGALGSYQGSKRIKELCSELNATQNGSNPASMLPPEVGSEILWQKDEVYVDNIKCKEFIENKKNAKEETRNMGISKMKEYKVILDESIGNRNNPNIMERKINELAQEGYRVVSSCAFRTTIGDTRIYIFLERET